MLLLCFFHFISLSSFFCSSWFAKSLQIAREDTFSYEAQLCNLFGRPKYPHGDACGDIWRWSEITFYLARIYFWCLFDVVAKVASTSVCSLNMTKSLQIIHMDVELKIAEGKCMQFQIIHLDVELKICGMSNP